MRRFLALSFLCSVLAGCATPENHYDPLEPINRKVYGFNSTVDNAVVKPVAKAYVKVTPEPLQTGIHNFFGNLEDLYIGANNLLQGKWQQAGSDVGRVALNTTLGLAGFIDIATPARIPKHNEDFGQTLGVWGVGSGPYLVVPFLGTKTLRDTGDWIMGAYMDPVGRIGYVPTRNSLTATRLLDTRASLLSADTLIDTASFDEYSFVRDGYLQRRYNLIYDGNPPKPLKMGDDGDDIDVKSIKINGQ